MRDYLIEYTKCSCSHNVPDVKDFECSLRNESELQNLIDVRLELTTPIKEFHVRVIIHFFRKKMPRMTLIDTTLNGCNFMETISKNKLLSIIRKTFHRYINEIPRCPLKKV